jgi:hypothetical protein
LEPCEKQNRCLVLLERNGIKRYQNDTVEEQVLVAVCKRDHIDKRGATDGYKGQYNIIQYVWLGGGKKQPGQRSAGFVVAP